MTTYTNPHAAEVAHDTKLLELMVAEYRATAWVGAAADKLRRAAAAAFADRRGDGTVKFWNRQALPVALADVADGTIVSRYEGRGGDSYHVVRGGEMKAATLDDCRAATMPDDKWERGHNVEKRDEAAADYDSALAASEAARDAIVEHEKGYTGWNRFVVVTPTGHVHRSMECSTCNKGRYATRFAPVPSLAGASVAEAIALLGPTMCTVCFPDAPVDMTAAKLTEAAVKVLIEDGEDAFRAKLAEIAAKAAEKCDAGPYDHSGPARPNMYRPYGTCNKCGAGVSLTSTGKMRAHKPKTA